MAAQTDKLNGPCFSKSISKSSDNGEVNPTRSYESEAYSQDVFYQELKKNNPMKKRKSHRKLNNLRTEDTPHYYEKIQEIRETKIQTRDRKESKTFGTIIAPKNKKKHN